jgi:ATP-binding cassette subfamily B protein
VSRRELKTLSERLRFSLGHVLHSSRFLFLGVLAVAVVGGLLPLLQIYLTTNLINEFVYDPFHAFVRSPSFFQTPNTLLWFVLLVGVVWLNGFVQACHPYFTALVRERAHRRLYDIYFRHLLSLSLAQREIPSIQDKIQEAKDGVRVLPQFWTDATLGLLATGLGLVGILIAMGRVSWVLPLLLLGVSIPVLQWSIRGEEEFQEIYSAQTPHKRQLDYWRRLLTDRRSVTEVRLYGLEPYFRGNWLALTQELLKELRQGRLTNQGKYFLEICFSQLGFAIAIVILMFVARQGRLDIGLFVALIYSLKQYDDMLADLSYSMQLAVSKWTKIGALHEFLNLSSDETHGRGSAPVAIREGINFENVSFRYPGSEVDSVRFVSFCIRPGERIALVGENGAGKSTVAKLLLGLYAPTSGRITVDGVDLSSVDITDWRRRVGAVFQDFMRYSLTVRDNIGFGYLERSADDDALVRAAGASRADEFIAEFPGGYDQALGKEFGGRELSYGQWQKLAIARAYIRDAEVLVLDEPTSALDVQTEFDTYSQFQAAARGKTVLLISHRLGSARLADRVLYLERGALLEEGTHDELIAASGPYSHLYLAQAEWYDGGGETEMVTVDA